MKRKVEKTALKNSSIKAQATFFRNTLMRTLQGNNKLNVQSEDLPTRGVDLLNITAKLAFGFEGWDALLHHSLNSNTTQDSDVYFYDANYFNGRLAYNAIFLQENYLTHVRLDEIEKALEVTALFMPKAYTRLPQTTLGRKLCYSLCRNSTHLGAGKHCVIANIDSKDDNGLLMGFSQIPCHKHGNTAIEFAKFFSLTEKKVFLVPVECVRSASEFDAFAAYRPYQFADFSDLASEYLAYENNAPLKQGYVTVADRVIALKSEGKSISVAVYSQKANQIHEFPYDDELDIKRLRELYNDTTELVFLARN